MKRRDEATDEIVERVLAGLGAVEAPEGMEGRVLETLTAVTRPRRPMPSGAAGDWRPAWAVAAAGVLAVSLVWGWGSLRESRQPRDVVSSAPRREALPPTQQAVRPPVARPAGPVTVQRAARRGQRTVHREVAEVWRDDPQFLRRMHARSFPAPPEPLTAQEKLLQQIAQRGDAVQRAELDPVVREKRYAEETEAVVAFFDPPRSPQKVQAEKDKKEEMR